MKISIDSALDNRKVSFRLFVLADDKMCDEGRVVRIVMEMSRVMVRNCDNSD